MKQKRRRFTEMSSLETFAIRLHLTELNVRPGEKIIFFFIVRATATERRELNPGTCRDRDGHVNRSNTKLRGDFRQR